MAESAARPARPQRGAADIGYLRAVYENAPPLAEHHPGDYGPVTPLTREIILSLLDELEAKLDTTQEVAGRVADVIVALDDIYLREGVHIWLTGRHKLLDNRAPLDVIRDPGGLERVEALVDQLVSGAHT